MTPCMTTWCPDPEKAVKELNLGDLADENTVMGPVITAAHRDRVEGFVSRAKATGHTELLQGDNPRHRFLHRPHRGGRHQAGRRDHQRRGVRR